MARVITGAPKPPKKTKSQVKEIGRRAAVGGERTGTVAASRSAAVVKSGARPKAFAKGYAKGAAARKAAGGKHPAKGSAKYLAASSGTTKGEVRGVIRQLRAGKITKGAAVKALKGGPRRGMPAGNKKQVGKAIRRLRSR